MSRLQIGSFATLVLATLAAFFVVQHLKVTTPLINGTPLPQPVAFNPVSGVTGSGGEPRVCETVVDKRRVVPNYTHTFLTFYLQKRPDHVAVYIVDTAGTIVRTLAQNYDFRHTYRRNPPDVFLWNGRQDNAQLAPDGSYYYRIVLLGQGRTVQIGRPVQIITSPPRPRIDGVTPTVTSAAHRSVRIRYSGVRGDANELLVYRAGTSGAPQLVKRFRVPSRRTSATWNGLIGGRPAPSGTYLLALRAIDAACNTGTDPNRLPPVPGAAQSATVSVQSLTADPPLSSTPAGSPANVYVYAPGPYSWALRRADTKPILDQGYGTAATLTVRVPSGRAGLYWLAIRSGQDRIVVPLIGGRSLAAARQKVLVVLPALSWQGLNPVAGPGGRLDTLSAGQPVPLERPFAELPPGVEDESALLSALDGGGQRYDLTSDISLLQDPAKILADYPGVVLAGSERWLPRALQSALRAYVAQGGRLLSVGVGALQRTVTLSGGTERDPSAATATDLFGATPGALQSAGRALTTVFADPLGVFGNAAAFSGVTSFQPIRPPSGVRASTAGITPHQTPIVAFRSGQGEVIEVGLPDFGALVRSGGGFPAFVAHVWRVLGG